MVSPYQKGAKNSEKAFSVFNDGIVVAGSGTLTTTDAAIAVAHGLGATPDFVLCASSLAVGAGAASGKFGWAANATTITFTKADTGATETFSYILGVLT